MKNSDILSYVTSFFVHVFSLLALIFVIHPSVPKPVKERFNVLWLYEPKAPVIEQKSVPNLIAQEKSSGASKLAKNEEPKAVKEGLKKGISIAEQKVVSPKVEARRQKAEGRLKKRGEEFKIARKEIRNQDVVREEEGEFKKFEEKINRDKEALEKGNDTESIEKRPLSDGNKTGEKSGFSARKIDKDLLAKYAGPSNKDGLGGDDEEGEGGIDKYAGGGKVVDLNTSDLRFLSYFKHIKDLIESVWIYPREARERGIDGHLVIKFTIKENGELGPVELVSSSGYKFLDDAAIQALNDASPFPNFPKQWKKKEITIAGNFIYYLYRGGVFY